MRAAYYQRRGSAREVLILGERPCPELGAEDVLVKVAVSGVNPHDIKSRSGFAKHPLPASHVIPHADAAGTICAVGSAVDPERMGRRVWCFRADIERAGAGTAAEYAVFRTTHAIDLPNHISLHSGASIGGPAITAHTCVFRDGPVAGQTLLIQGGAGAVGQYAIQFARWAGARVIATASTPEKQVICRELGAEWVLDYRSKDFATAALDLTLGSGVDRIVDVDLGENLDRDLALIKTNGIIASISATRKPRFEINYYAVADKGVTLHFIQNRHLSEQRRMAAVTDISTLLKQNQLKVPSPWIFSLSDIAAAHEALERGAQGRKVLVEL